MGHTLLGIVTMLVATSMTNIGAVVQKKAVDRLPPFDQTPLLDSVRAVLRTPLWLLGWGIASLAIVLNMVAVGLAAISIIQPLNGFGLVVLAICSRLYLGERLTPATLAGIGLVVAGVALVGLAAPQSRSFTGVEPIVACYAQRSAWLCLGGLVIGILLLCGVASRLPAVAGILFAAAAAGCSVVGLSLAKGLFGMLGIAGISETFSTWPAWLLAVLVPTFSTASMAVQQLSFQKGRAVVVTPVFAATSVLLPLVVGRFVFGEHLPPLSYLATACIVLGVILLGRQVEDP